MGPGEAGLCCPVWVATDTPVSLPATCGYSPLGRQRSTGKETVMGSDCTFASPSSLSSELMGAGLCHLSPLGLPAAFNGLGREDRELAATKPRAHPSQCLWPSFHLPSLSFPPPTNGCKASCLPVPMRPVWDDRCPFSSATGRQRVRMSGGDVSTSLTSKTLQRKRM